MRYSRGNTFLNGYLSLIVGTFMTLNRSFNQPSFLTDRSSAYQRDLPALSRIYALLGRASGENSVHRFDKVKRLMEIFVEVHENI